jgi:hypothetical protein
MYSPTFFYHEFFPALMRNKIVAKLFGMCVDVEIKLRKDREPYVFGPDGQVVVAAVGMEGCPNPAIGRRRDMLLGEEGLWDGTLDDPFAVFGILGAGSLKQSFN